jgi:hypothetical protein
VRTSECPASRVKGGAVYHYTNQSLDENGFWEGSMTSSRVTLLSRESLEGTQLWGVGANSSDQLKNEYFGARGIAQ